MTNLSGLFTPSPLITANAVSMLTANNTLYLSGVAGNTYAQKNNPTFTGNTTAANLAVTGILAVTGNVSITNTLTTNAVSANGSVGSNGQILTSDGSKSYWATPTPGGLSEIDMWAVTTNIGSPSSGTWAAITTNLARPTGAFTKVGTGMTESSGVFTFPSTGTWQIYVQGAFYSTNSGDRYTSIQYSTDGGSTWNTAGSQSYQIYTDISYLSFTTLVTVTNTANFKVRWGNSRAVYAGTFITFKKLA